MARRPLGDEVLRSSVSRTRSTPTVKNRIGQNERNRDPVYLQTFQDGSYVEADSSGAIKSSREASASASRSAQSPSPIDQLEVIQDPQGRPIKYRDPKTGHHGP